MNVFVQMAYTSIKNCLTRDWRNLCADAEIADLRFSTDEPGLSLTAGDPTPMRANDLSHKADWGDNPSNGDSPGTDDAWSPEPRTHLVPWPGPEPLSKENLHFSGFFITLLLELALYI